MWTNTTSPTSDWRVRFSSSGYTKVCCAYHRSSPCYLICDSHETELLNRMKLNISDPIFIWFRLLKANYKHHTTWSTIDILSFSMLTPFLSLSSFCLYQVLRAYKRDINIDFFFNIHLILGAFSLKYRRRWVIYFEGLHHRLDPLISYSSHSCTQSESKSV